MIVDPPIIINDVQRQILQIYAIGNVVAMRVALKKNFPSISQILLSFLIFPVAKNDDVRKHVVVSSCMSVFCSSTTKYVDVCKI